MNGQLRNNYKFCKFRGRRQDTATMRSEHCAILYKEANGTSNVQILKFKNEGTSYGQIWKSKMFFNGKIKKVPFVNFFRNKFCT